MDPEGGSAYQAGHDAEGAAAYEQQQQQQQQAADAWGAGYDPQGAGAYGAYESGDYSQSGTYSMGVQEQGAAAAYEVGAYGQQAADYESSAGYAAAEGGTWTGASEAAAGSAWAGEAPAGSTWGEEGAEAGAEAGAETLVAPAGAVAASSGYSPAEYLRYLEGEVQRLSASKAQLEQAMAALATAAYQQLSPKLEEAGTGVPVPADVPSLVEELTVLLAVRQYMQYLQELEAMTRHVEKALGNMQQAQQGEECSAGFLQAASEAVEAFSHALTYAAVVQALSTEKTTVPSHRLKAHAQRLVLRVEAAQSALHSQISEAIQSQLAHCAWPPALSVGSCGAGGGAAVAAQTSPFAAPGAAPHVQAVQQLLAVLLTLQRAVQHAEFQALAESPEGPDGSGSGVGELPLLWAAEELAQGVAARLRHHFADGLPTDRVDKPEWLFAAALKAVQQNAAAVAIFQPCIDAHELQSRYNMQFEFARAVQSVGLNAILREHLLPKLAAVAAEAGEPGAGDASALWLHYADEAMQFEKRFAPLRGQFVVLTDEEEEGLASAHLNSSIDLLFSDPAWKEGWLQAEQWDALRQLDAACDAFNAWQPAQLGLVAQVGDFELETPRARDRVASHQEFWPPACAEQVAALATSLVRRAGWVAGAENRLAFVQAVPLGALHAFRERLGRQLAVAEGYKDLLSEQWLPSLGAAICAAHYVEHQLREPQGVLLLLELQDAQVAAANDANQGPAPAISHEPPPPQQQQRRAAGPSGVAALVEKEAAAFGVLRRQWAYKLAKQAVERFHELFAPYKHDLSIFTVGYDSEAPSAGEGGEEVEGAASVSPLMLVAADKLLHMLGVLSQHLDAVVFRDVWKAVALAVNYAAFNDVATEALFSRQGTRQFEADVNALAAVFGEYTSRPAAHFKETKEACKLLLLQREEAAAVLSALQRQPGAAKEVLRPMGVKLLNVDQAASVLMQRLDLLTSGH